MAKHYLGFAWAFSLPFFLLLVAFVLFVGGRRRYRVVPPKGSIIGTVVRVTRDARRHRREGLARGDGERAHWLDWARDAHPGPLVDDVAGFFKVLPIFACFPAFWALFDQQGSAWTLQAKEMNLDLGGFSPQSEQF